MMRGPTLGTAIVAIALLLLFASYRRRKHTRPVRRISKIRETAPGQFSVLWRTPVLAGRRLPVALQLPDARRT